MKFLVIGASGFIGRHTLHYIKSLGYEAVGTQAKAKNPDLVKFDLLEDRIEWQLDTAYLETDSQVFGIIFSAITPIDRCWRERELSYKVNVEKTCQLLDDFKNLGIKPIFISSEAVYDGTTGYYSEEHQPNPVNEYGKQKLAVERYIQQMSPETLILRLSKIVGDDPKESHLFSEWHQWMETNKPITCIAGQVFCPTFVEDIAKGILLSCQQGISGLYNMANPVFFPREELAKQFALALGQEAQIICKPQEAFNFADKRNENNYLDSTKFLKATGMQFTSMREVFTAFTHKLKEDSK
ncbi:MAG TPA: hypothetical protein DCS91_06565 [Microcoleaceae bacterium UBA11344]|nr:hypothetical protein [Microcoleaceae cyanobacterium UBA11344]